MKEFLLKFLFDVEVPADSEWRLVFTNAPQSWHVFILLAVIAALVYWTVHLYRKENPNCPRRWKNVLIALRTFVILIVILVFLGPAIKIGIRRTIEPVVLLLLDDSMSMSIKDKYLDDETAEAVADARNKTPEELREEQPARVDVVTDLLTKNDAEFVRALSNKAAVQVISFSDEIQLRELVGSTADAETTEQSMPGIEKGTPIPPLTPQGANTRISKALNDSLEAVAGTKVAAVILFSDGQETSVSDPKTKAVSLAKAGIPLYTVGIGDPSPPRNVRVVELTAPPRVTKEDPFELEARIQVRGIEGEEAVIELRVHERAKSGEKVAERLLESKTIQLNDGVQTVTFKDEPSIAGELVYTVVALPIENELIETDNKQSVVVDVKEGRARVLLIAGAPNWDYRSVKTFLTRERTVELSCWLQSLIGAMPQDGNKAITALPKTKEELFKYDLVMMFDPDPSDFDEEWIKVLKEFVGKHAGGLIWMSAPKFTPEFLSRKEFSGLIDVLPMKLGDQSDIAFAGGPTGWKQMWRFQVAGSGADHPIIRLSEDPSLNTKIWERMPGFYWSLPAQRAKPGAKALLEHSNPVMSVNDVARPLLVVGNYGPGRVVMFGFDGTWRWKWSGRQNFERFWIKTVRAAMEGRWAQSQKQGEIFTDKNSYSVGDRIQVNARLFDQKFEPLKEKTVTLKLRGPNRQEVDVIMNPRPGAPGHYEGTVTARFLGRNSLSVTLPGLEGEEIIEQEFTVEIPNIEFASPFLNRPLLHEIATVSGGAMFAPNELDQLAQSVPNRRETMVIPSKPLTLWDRPWLLILLTLILSAEWIIRKIYKMI